MKFVRGFNLVLGISLFAGILTMAVSYLLSKGNTRLSMTLCVVVSVSIFSLYYLLTSVGDLFTSSLFGMGREVDALAMEAESLEEKGVSNEKGGRYEEAIEHYKELIYSKGNRLPEKTAYKIGRLYEEKLLQLRDAIYWYRKAIALACKKGKSNENTFAKESQVALARLGNIFDNGGKSTDEDLTLIKTLIESKEFVQAHEKLKAAVQLYPGNSEVKYLFAHYYLFQNNMGMAVEYFGRTIDIDPEFLPAIYFKGGALLKMGHHLEAKETFEDYLAKAKGRTGEKARVENAIKRLKKIKTGFIKLEFDGPGR